MKRYLLCASVFTCFFLFLRISAAAQPVEGVAVINDREYASTVQHLLDGAENSIKFVLYQVRFYEKYPDSASNKLIESLIDAQERGVTVKGVLDLSPFKKQDTKYNKDAADRLTKAGCEVFLDDPEVQSHGKVIVIDEMITIIGSTNWAYYSIARNSEASVAIWSPQLAREFTAYIDEIAKNSDRVEVTPEVVEETHKSELKIAKHSAENVVSLSNEKYFPALHKAIEEAKESIRVVQLSVRYYTDIPTGAPRDSDLPNGVLSHTNELCEDLIRAHKRGIDVQVIIDRQAIRSNEEQLPFARKLAQNGVTVFWDDENVTTHAKLIVIDDDITVVGSTNWTYHALHLNNEVSVLIRSKPVNKIYRDYFKKILKKSVKLESGG